MFKSIACIINPFAGGRSALKKLREMQAAIQERGVRMNLEVTRSSEHATEIARELASAFEVVAAVGGDGTVNRIANGIIGTASTLAVIPNGSGNDFASLLGLSGGIRGAMQAVLDGETQLFDVGRVQVNDDEGFIYFLNTLGIGFDGAVAYEAHKIRYLKGLALYLLGLARTLRTFHPVQMSIRTDELRTYGGNYYLACLANGEREGGGFLIAPGADPTDGLLDMCLIRGVPLTRVPRLVAAVLRGQHLTNPDVEYARLRRVTIGCSEPVPLHADGEVYCGKTETLEVEVVSQYLRAVVGKSFRNHA